MEKYGETKTQKLPVNSIALSGGVVVIFVSFYRILFHLEIRKSRKQRRIGTYNWSVLASSLILHPSHPSFFFFLLFSCCHFHPLASPSPSSTIITHHYTHQLLRHHLQLHNITRSSYPLLPQPSAPL